MGSMPRASWMARSMAAVRPAVSAMERDRPISGRRTTSAPAAESSRITRSEFCVPMAGTSVRLTASAPRMAPKVLAAYTDPTRREESFEVEETAAQAKGKLAPQRMVGGRMAHRQRTISSWKLYQGLAASMGLMGQYGMESAIM